MSAAIKKMLADRAAREKALSGHSNRFDEAIERLRAAAPRLDAGFNSTTKWKPSERLLIGFCVLATGAHPESAYEFLRDELTAVAQ